MAWCSVKKSTKTTLILSVHEDAGVKLKIGHDNLLPNPWLFINRDRSIKLYSTLHNISRWYSRV